MVITSKVHTVMPRSWWMIGTENLSPTSNFTNFETTKFQFWPLGISISRSYLWVWTHWWIWDFCDTSKAKFPQFYVLTLSFWNNAVNQITNYRGIFHQNRNMVSKAKSPTNELTNFEVLLYYIGLMSNWTMLETAHKNCVAETFFSENFERR